MGTRGLGEEKPRLGWVGINLIGYFGKIGLASQLESKKKYKEYKISFI